jgi:hypothetical protein
MTSRLVLSIGAGVMLAIVACTPSAPPSPASQHSASPTGASTASGDSPATTSPGALPTDSPPIATFEPVALAELRWGQIGDLGAGRKRGGGFVSGGFVFGDAYVVYGSDADERTVVWTSNDGRSWESDVLGEVTEACPGAGLYPEAIVSNGATDGQRIVLVGLQFQVGGTECNTQRAVSWVSSDGHLWERSPPFASGHPRAVWAADGAWEAAVWNGTGVPGTLWRSADARIWSALPTPATAPQIDQAWLAGPDGTRLMFMQDQASDQSRLQRSSDGVTWQDVDQDFNGAHEATFLRPLAPRSPGRSHPWLLVADHYDEPAVTWISMDLLQWQSGSFPAAHVANVAVTRFGFLGTGEGPFCGVPPLDCVEPPPRQFLGTDGLAWTALPTSVIADLILDGPAGVLAIGVGNAGEVFSLGD